MPASLAAWVRLGAAAMMGRASICLRDSLGSGSPHPDPLSLLGFAVLLSRGLLPGTCHVALMTVSLFGVFDWPTMAVGKQKGGLISAAWPCTEICHRFPWNWSWESGSSFLVLGSR